MAGDYFSRSGRERVAGYIFSCMGWLGIIFLAWEGRNGGWVLFFSFGVGLFFLLGEKKGGVRFFPVWGEKKRLAMIFLAWGKQS